MNIQGYAFDADRDQTIAKYRKRYEEIKHFGLSLNIRTRPDYAHTHFSGELTTEETQNLSEFDLALIADRGNLCFGGQCTKSGSTFTGSYNTD